jgi:hypothetical protein
MATTYTQSKPYIRAPQPASRDSDRKYLESELRKIEDTLRVLLIVIAELQAAVTALEP